VEISRSWELLNGLEKKYGDSFYLLEPRTFRENYAKFLGGFRKYYANTNIAYSYKTNYTPKICQLVNDWGGYAEVVSRMEYDLALRVGVAPEKIIFNGPYKSRVDLELAMLAGSIVNLDSPYELDLVEAVARRHVDKFLKVGIRCNFDLGTGHVSRFGFDAEGSDLLTAICRLREIRNCSVIGLHCHFLTPGSRAEAYGLMAQRMLDLAIDHFADQPPRFIDLGGGFFSQMAPELKKQFDHPIPTFEEYAKAIAPKFAQTFRGGSGPELLLEPGIALTADAMYFVARVMDIKSIRSRKVALVAGSIYNIKPTLHSKNLPISIVSPIDSIVSRTAESVVDIVGYTCMEHDVLYKSYAGALAVGDYVVFSNVGSYTTVLKPPFINPCPAMIGYDPETGECELVKRKETTLDIFSTYAF
jgi:diaminopimelate decarboxylase